MTQRRVPKEHRIPTTDLDPAILRVRFNMGHDYGLDSFTTYDCQCVRRFAGRKYDGIPLDDIKLQVINCRKSGRLKLSTISGRKGSPKACDIGETAKDYLEYLESEHWQKFRALVLAFWDHCCCLNHEHTKNLEVHHRRYTDKKGRSILWHEKVRDCVVLCAKCHKRHHKYEPGYGE